MAASLLRKGIPLLRPRLQQNNLLAAGILSSSRRPWCTAAEPAGHEEEVSYAEKRTAMPGVSDPPKYHMCDDPDDKKWSEKKEEIFRDILPRVSLAREILHSNRYMNGDRLTAADEEAVVEKLLRYHPNSEDKIGCGLDSIVVDRHPEHRSSRCLFVLRTDSGLEDFSYLKCLRAYLRDKYPSHSERFIQEYFLRRSLNVKRWPQEVKGSGTYNFFSRKTSNLYF